MFAQNLLRTAFPSDGLAYTDLTLTLNGWYQNLVKTNIFNRIPKSLDLHIKLNKFMKSRNTMKANATYNK